jgi:cobyrinic acid a,c-diamide synthase
MNFLAVDMTQVINTYEALMQPNWACPYEDCSVHTKSLTGMRKHLIKIHEWHWSECEAQ